MQFKGVRSHVLVVILSMIVVVGMFGVAQPALAQPAFAPPEPLVLPNGTPSGGFGPPLVELLQGLSVAAVARPASVPEIRISDNPVGIPWLYLFRPIVGEGGILFEGPNTNGPRIAFFRFSGRHGRIHRGASVTGEVLYTVDFPTGRIWAGPNSTGPLLYTLEVVPIGAGLQVRIHEGNDKGPIIYTVIDDDLHEGPNEVGPLVFHGNQPLAGPILFFLPLLADQRIP